MTHNNIPLNIEKDFKFKFIDLFAGIGGFHLAMHKAGGDCVFASEWDKYARQTYESNFIKSSPELFNSDKFIGDINSISEDLSVIPDFDVLCAGFPCQPFSYSGRNEGFKDKTRGTLFFKILEILEYKRPKAFLLENVKGLKSHDKGKTLSTILDSLNRLGYSVHWEVLSSLNFGVPQKRERWYCIGFDKKVNFDFPTGSKETPALRDIIDSKADASSLKLSDFEMERIKFHFDNTKGQGDRIQHDSSKYAPNTKKGKYGIFSYQKPDGSLRFHVGDRAKTQIQEAFYCSLDTYAPTIIANRVPKLWDLQRKLSVLEAKRLQGFPDSFMFPVSDNQAYKQLGNSVTIPVVYELSKRIVEVLKEEYENQQRVSK